MKTKLLLKVAATLGAFVLVGGISVAALARSGASSSTPPRLPVVSTPEPTETESPQADDSQDSNNHDSEDSNHDSEDSNDDSEDSNDDTNDDSNHDSEDSNENSDDQGENSDDQGEDADDQGENEAEDD
jgi:hypothetical protein